MLSNLEMAKNNGRNRFSFLLNLAILNQQQKTIEISFLHFSMKTKNATYCLLRLLALLFLSVSTHAQTVVEQEISWLKDSLSRSTDSVQTHLYIEMALKYRSLNSDSSTFYLLKAFDQEKQANSNYLKARLYTVKGILSNDKGAYDIALNQLDTALKKVENTEEHKLIGSIYINKANTYKAIKDFEQTLANQTRGIEHYEKAQDSSLLAIGYQNLGYTYLTLGDKKEARKYLELAVQIYRNKKKYAPLASCLNMLAIYYFEEKETDKAEEYALESVAMYDSLGGELHKAYPLSVLGSVYREKKEWVRSEKYYTESLKLHQKANANTVSLFLINDVAKAKLQLNKVSEALELAESGYQKAEEIDFKSVQYLLGFTLSEALSKSNNYQEAYNVLVTSTLIRDSIFSEERLDQAAKFKEQFESEKKEREILQQKKQLIQNELELTQKNRTIQVVTALLIILALIAISIVLMLRLKAKKIQAKAELDQVISEHKTQENLKEQRLRIARDLHDTIGSELTYISSLADLAMRQTDLSKSQIVEKVSQIKLYTNSTIAELRDTLWAMNKEEITLEDIQNRTHQLASKVEAATACSVKIHDSPYQLKVDAFVGMNIFRIIQEAINNAVKHAQTQEINVTFCVDQGKEFQVSIKDGGIGFDTSGRAAGNGMQIMRNRAHQIGAILSISSILTEGTEILLTKEKASTE